VRETEARVGDYAIMLAPLAPGLSGLN
jgi:hypothetical protein